MLQYLPSYLLIKICIHIARNLSHLFTAFKPRLHLQFLLTLATRYIQSCSATKVEGGCKSSQVTLKSATCCRKFDSMNTLQHCRNDFVATFLFHNPCNIRKKCQCYGTSPECSLGFIAQGEFIIGPLKPKPRAKLWNMEREAAATCGTFLLASAT